MKVLTILGTRPEIIRLSRVIARLDALCNHVVVHTGQNYDPTLSDVFFQQLGVRNPDHHLHAKGRFGEQIGVILAGIESILLDVQPDRFLVLGDTNSSLAAIMAKRLGIPVYHMEAGNRCYDDRVPEEVNRRIIDHSSDVLLPYTERSRHNLLREGIPGERIFVTGNPIFEVLNFHQAAIGSSTILQHLGLQPGQYFLVTMHRAENVDVPSRLARLVEALDRLQREFRAPVVISTHPRTRDRLARLDTPPTNTQLHFLSPLGFFDFVALERAASCVLTDSGTVQEETAIYKVPAVTLRDTTERPETLECGCNILSGVEPDHVLAAVRQALSRTSPGQTPPEYLVENVSEKVAGIVLGFRRSVSDRLF